MSTNKNTINEWIKVINDVEINVEPLEIEKSKIDIADFIEELLNVKLREYQRREIRLKLHFKERDIYG